MPVVARRYAVAYGLNSRRHLDSFDTEYCSHAHKFFRFSDVRSLCQGQHLHLVSILERKLKEHIAQRINHAVNTSKGECLALVDLATKSLLTMMNISCDLILLLHIMTLASN